MEERLKFVKRILRYQKKWTSISFKKVGSLYLAHDVGKRDLYDLLYSNKHGAAIKDPRFAISPLIGRVYYHAGRALVPYYKGPCA